MSFTAEIRTEEDNGEELENSDHRRVAPGVDEPTITDTNEEGEEEEEEGTGGESRGSDVAAVGAAAGIGAAAAPIVTQAVLGVVGFGAQGVVGGMNLPFGIYVNSQLGGKCTGSMAAGIQAGIGNVAAGSLFATCQSIAMGGAFPVVGFAIGAAIAGSWAYGAVKKRRQRQREEREGAASY
ncbi:hypothetical protein BV25DRAFT_1912830 [Artomyces pyxidatus]|uniref:Uncharacterized protein n=1 Tax=Artomyces pyxidatus TaxID=48021 RepID=A0ACB8TCE0_9AGAM|nr:hypothetical protein BV25DRAFT_1912830 [Artomyces pyxidatus]